MEKSIKLRKWYKQSFTPQKSPSCCNTLSAVKRWWESKSIMDSNHGGSKCFTFKSIDFETQTQFSQLNTKLVRRIRSRRGTKQLSSPSPGHTPELQRLHTEPIPKSKAGDTPSHHHGPHEPLTYDCSGSSKSDNEEDHSSLSDPWPSDLMTLHFIAANQHKLILII